MRTRIHIFVAGGLAFLGLRVLALNAVNLVKKPDIATWIGLPIVALALPIGVAILFGSSKAVKVAWVYLTAWVVLQCAGVLMIAVGYPSAQEATWDLLWSRLPDSVLPQVVLWGLLICSKYGKFKGEREV